MKNKEYIISILIIFLLFSSCSEIQKMEYDNQGNLVSISHFKRKSSNYPYLIKKFSKDGNLISQLNYDRNGKPFGICYEINYSGDSIVKDYSKFTNYMEQRYFLSNGEKYISMFLDSLEHGVSRHFVDDKLFRRALFDRGNCIAYETYNYNLPKYTKLSTIDKTTNTKTDSVIFSNDSIEYSVTQFRINGDQTGYHTIGNYFVNSFNKSIDNRYSTYFLAETLDTITVKDSVIVSVYGNLDFINDFSYKLIIGDVDSFNVFDNITNKNINHFDVNRFLQITLPPQKPGYHFIVGSVFVDVNNRQQQYVVYDDFIVK